MSSVRKTVLVVDDDAAVRDGLVAFLEDEGYGALGVENGRRALEVLETMEAPRLILLDLMMPVMDGWQFLAERSRRSNATPVVLLSGLSFINDAPGVADFLCKPVNYEKLRDCLGRFCGSPGPAA
ncbi:MAG TPA: response regulator [Thermoanaerobaculia bacterium]|jgi:CheY-like chemotaxis protein